MLALEIDHLTTAFGALRAVDDVSLAVAAGSITGLIGPNGAGKSTLFNSVVGAAVPLTGSIRLHGERIDALTPERVFRLGLAHTFQIPRPFAEMTVLENLMLATPGQAGERFWSALLRPAGVRRQERAIMRRAFEILDFTTLAAVAGSAAGRLSGGQQKLLELARILMGEPRLILLDEPAAGVNPALTQVLIEKIRELNARGMTFFVIEHDMDFVMGHCDPIIAMAGGKVIFEGSSREAVNDPGLRDAYLGELPHV